MCISHASFGDFRNDVFTKIVAGAFVVIVFFQQLIKVIRVKDIDTHTRQRFAGIARHRRRISRFFDEIDNLIALVHRHDPNARASSIGTGIQATVQRAPFST
jgi:hypothetical protein